MDTMSAERSSHDQKDFDEAQAGPWCEVFFDACTDDYREKWFLDGEVASVTNHRDGMRLAAGPKPLTNDHHMVLWTNDSFSGDLKIEYEYTRLDFATQAVNIIYIQATGSGDGPYSTDIREWNALRRTPAMSMYFDHMNTYHISYAAYVNEEGNEANDDYVRARRYMSDQGGLNHTDLEPDYFKTDLFNPGVSYNITIIKRDQRLFMRVSHHDVAAFFVWNNNKLPPITEGRIGLRHMASRSARYKDFRVSVPE